MRTLLLAICGLLVAPSAWSCVNLNFTLATSNFNLNSNSNPTVTANVTANTSLSGCSYFLTVNYGSATSYSTRALERSSGAYEWPYQVYDGSFVLKTLADATSNNDILEGTFNQQFGNQTQSKSFQVLLDTTNLYLRYGNYDDTVTVTLYSGTRTSATLVRTRNFNLSYTAAKKIDLSIVDPASAFSESDVTQLMDFGANMTTGSTASADLLVKYNAGYRIRMSSLRGGVLKHATLTTTIPYTFKYNGSTITLTTTTATVENANGVAPTDGLRRTLQAIVGSTAGKSPGVYEDTITITVQSNE